MYEALITTAGYMVNVALWPIIEPKRKDIIAKQLHGYVMLLYPYKTCKVIRAYSNTIITCFDFISQELAMYLVN